jgi:large subunit ribosomal protein L10e
MHAKNYRHVKNRAYTRKKYARGFPPPKIVKFTMGDTKGTFEVESQLIGQRRAQIRHRALEFAHVATNRILMDKLMNDYLMVIHPQRHIILRENKMIFGVHANRLQQGLKRSFGSAISISAKVEVEQSNTTFRVKANQRAVATESLKRGSAKLPTTCKRVISKIVASPTMTETVEPKSPEPAEFT